MKYRLAIVALIAWPAALAAFAPAASRRTSGFAKLQIQQSSKTQLHATDVSWSTMAAKAVSAAFVTAALWSAPALLYSNENQFVNLNQVHAKEMASASGSRVNKDPESLLRYGLPINNKEVRRLGARLTLIPELLSLSHFFSLQ